MKKKILVLFLMFFACKITYAGELRLNITETLNDVNGFYGDAKIEDVKYEIYKNNELLKMITDLDNIVLESDTIYVFKDVSKNDGVINMDDMEYRSLMIYDWEDMDTYLYIDKNIIKKDINFLVEDDYKYDIYLKSSDEKYYEIDKLNNKITLPYGIYYIKNDEGFYKEFSVINDIEDTIKLKTIIIDDQVDKDIKEDTVKSVSNIIYNEEVKVEEVKNDYNLFDDSLEVEEDILEEYLINEDKLFDNIYEDDYLEEIPKTGGSNYVLVFIILFNLLIIKCDLNNKSLIK